MDLSVLRFFNYQTMAATGIVVTFAVSFWLCIRLEQNWTRQIPLMLGSLVGMIAGAKLFGMLSYATYLAELGSQVTLDEVVFSSGIVFYGGLLGYLGTFWLLSRFLLKKRRLGFDILAVTTPLFHGFARIGCYVAQREIDGVMTHRPCCYGIVMDNAFCAHFFESRLPVQLIEAAFNFLLFFALLSVLLTERDTRRRGNLLPFYLTLYAAFRFVIEGFRGDAVRGGFGTLSFSQGVSLVIVLGMFLYCILARLDKLKPLPLDPYDPDVERFRLFSRTDGIEDESEQE